MPAENELTPKVETMKRLAKERYGLYLGAIGLKLEGDLVVIDPQNRAVVDPPPDPAQEQQRWVTFQSDVDSLCTRIEKFYPLEPFDLTLIGGKLGGTAGPGVVENLGPTNASGCIGYAESHWMSRVDGMINERQWSGDAADAFHRQFLFPFHTAAQQQRFYLRELRIAIQSYHDAIAGGINDIHTILDACNATLGGDHDSPHTEAAYTVIGIVSGAVGLVAGGPVGVLADVLGLATGYYSGIAGEAAHPNDGLRPELRVYGGNAPQIIGSTWDAVVRLEGYIADVDEQLDRGLTRDLDHAFAFASPGLRLDRPDLADLDRPEDFGRLQIESADGVPLSENDVVASIVDLYQAGYVNLPAASNEYAQAGELLGECQLPGYLTWFFQRSPLRYEESRLRLAGILLSTQHSLTDCGTNLVQIATAYQLSDEENAEAMRQIGEFDAPVPRTAHPRVEHGLPYR